MLNIHAKVSGEYTLTRIDKNGNKVQQVGPFRNLITDAGLDSLGMDSPNDVTLNSCMVGTSNATPSYTDTTLGNRVATTDSPGKSYNTGSSPSYHINVRLTYRFAQGAAAGNLAEVGIGKSSAGKPGGIVQQLFSRALIVDGAGNPTTITVLPDEFLDVTYTLRFYISNAISAPYKVTDTSTGIEHTLTGRICNVGALYFDSYGRLLPAGRNSGVTAYAPSSPGTPLAFTSTISGVFSNGIHAGGSGGSTVLPYVSGSYTSNSTVTFALSAANHANGIGGILTTYDASFPTLLGVPVGITITPAIAKTSSKTLKIGLQMSWSRI